MTTLHANEYHITKELVISLLESQCSQWAELPLEPIKSAGTDNALLRLGQNLVVRLPKIDWATNSIHKECVWIPQFAKHLNMPLSEPVFEGKADANYPWPWMIVKWNEGENPGFEKENEYETLAVDLAQFINQLHDIPLSDGPPSRRGTPLSSVDVETRVAIAALKDEIDVDVMTELWDSLSQLPEWTQKPVWVHGDLLPGNILVKNNRLSAVIDFSDVGVGDPATDLIIAWSLLNKNSRKLFRKNLKKIDDITWERGKGRALSIALIILPYYKNTNPILTTIARNIIRQILSD